MSSEPFLRTSVLISDEGNTPVVAVPHNKNPDALLLRQGRNIVTLCASELARLNAAVVGSAE
jgi:hypothetical protein